MSYQPYWTQGDASGRLVPGVHRLRDDDLLDLAREFNRRRTVGYVSSQDIANQVAPGLMARLLTLQGLSGPPFDSFRKAILDLLAMPPGGAGGSPVTPLCMEWLWSDSDGDSGATIVAHPPQTGQVDLMAKLNSSAMWTDADLTGRHIRAVHINELRWCLEKLYRGRWRLPIYSIAGIISAMPDTSWFGGIVAKSPYSEVRALAHATIRGDGTFGGIGQGLQNVTVLSSSQLLVSADQPCTIGIYRLLRNISFVDNPPTWNDWDPDGDAGWSEPGALGGGDASFLGQVNIVNGVGTFSSPALATALQGMVNGDISNFIFARIDNSYAAAQFQAELSVEFELNS